MKKSFLCLAAIILLVPLTAWPQPPSPSGPGDTLRRGQDTMEFFELERKLEEGREAIDRKEEEILDEGPKPIKEAPQGAEQTLLINKIVTNPSEILTAEELEEIFTAYEGKVIAIKDLFQIVEEINDLYKAKRMIAAKAILPPQKIKDGLVKIRLVEGHVGNIVVEDNKYTRASFFYKRIDIKSGDLVDIDQLKTDIIAFNNMNDVKVKAELKPGETVGTTDYVLKAQEPSNYNITVWSDNAGREDVGQYRLGALLSSKSLIGLRDPLTLGGYFAEGTAAGFIYYNIPINRYGTRLGLTGDYNQIEIISGPLADENVTGESYDIGGLLSHPFKATRNLKLNGFLEYHNKKSTTDFDGFTLYDNKVQTGVFGFDVQSFDQKGLWYSRNLITAGTSDNSEEIGNVKWNKDFVKFNTLTTRLQILPKDMIATFRLNAQFADSDELLPSTETFQIGGLSTVRGYSEGLRSGSHGYVINLQLDSPIPFTKGDLFDKPVKEILKCAVFFDHGGAFFYKGNDESIDSEDFLTSAGLGLLFNFSKYINGRIFWGYPFEDYEDNPYGMVNFYLWANFL